MSSLRTIEKTRFEELLGMNSGYVLDFSNDTFAQFFLDNANVDIYADRYAPRGDSKARRLRAFWELESDALVGRVLSALLDYWNYKNRDATTADSALADACTRIVERLLSAPEPVAGLDGQSPIEGLACPSLENLHLDAALMRILEARLSEAGRCLNNDAPLAAVIVCGSVLEGLLLGLALSNPQTFNRPSNSPKGECGKVKPFREWSLAQFIDVACELGYLTLDVKHFGHNLRDFRNYVHPYQQMQSGFNPDTHTAKPAALDRVYFYA